MTEKQTCTAEVLLSNELKAIQQCAAKQWEGREIEAVIALVRALDTLAVARSVTYTDGTTNDTRRQVSKLYALHGAARALQPFLSKIKGRRGGIPWRPSDQEAIRFVYPYLQTCGELSHLIRLASLEQYGLASTRVDDDQVFIETTRGTAELASYLSGLSLQNSDREPLPGGESPARERRRLKRRMRSYVDRDYTHDWFIRYDNDFRIVNSYRREAHEYGKSFFEREALPSNAVVGGRSFGEWRTACEHALGRVLTHIDFCLLLNEKHPDIALSNVLTIFARREDVVAVWLEAGLPADLVTATMEALTLDSDNLEDFERSFEIPCSLYVDLGADHVLLPCFGGLANPYYALFRHLRAAYPNEWATQANLRETNFRKDVIKAFPEPRFLVPSHGFSLKRPDKSVLTDIDAVILDKQTGTLALIQLKWHDIYGRSISERESRQVNAAAANSWIEKVCSWIGNKSSGDLVKYWGLKGPRSSNSPLLYVVTRYNARFSGAQMRDPRSAWLSWHEILMARSHIDHHDPLTEIPQWVDEFEASLLQEKKQILEYKFKNVFVKVCHG